jgi:hypothetical protein
MSKALRQLTARTIGYKSDACPVTIPRPVGEFLMAAEACGPDLPAADSLTALDHMYEAGLFGCLRNSWSRVLSADLWVRLRDMVHQVQEKAVEFAGQRWPLTRAGYLCQTELHNLCSDLAEFAARLPADRTAPPRDGVRDGTLYVNGVAKVPNVTPQQAELINLVWSHGKADAAALRDVAGICLPVNSLRHLATHCKDILKDAGVGWVISVRAKNDVLRYVEKKNLPPSIDRQ